MTTTPGTTRAPKTLIAPPLVRRLGCWVYEGLLLFAVVFVAGWLFSTLGQMRDAMDERRHLLQAFLFVVFGIYFVWFWTHGQTLAMKTWGLRLVDAVGRPLGQGRALLRYLLCWVWFLPPLALLAPFKLSGGEVILLLIGWVAVWALLSRFQRQRQFWHDIWAGTRIVAAMPA
ncbi:MAG: RDD family protein [Variovorax sp.]